MNSRMEELDQLTRELKQIIFDYLDHQTLRILELVNKTLRENVIHYAYNQFYYAVGVPIPLYSKISLFLDQIFFDGNGYLPSSISTWVGQRSSFSKKEIADSLVCDDNMIRVFNKPEDALAFSQLATSEEYDSKLDYFYTYAKPAIFVITLKNGLLTKLTPFEYGTIYSSSGVKRNTLNVLCTPAQNCQKIYFANFESKVCFFNSNKKTDKQAYSKIWESEFNLKERNIDEAILHVLIKLFDQYKKSDVDEIIELKTEHANNDTILKFLRSKQYFAQRMKDNNYVEMLEFAINKIGDVNEMKLLPIGYCRNK